MKRAGMDQVRAFAEVVYENAMDTTNPDWTLGGENDALFKADQALEEIKDVLQEDMRCELSTEVERYTDDLVGDLMRLAEALEAGRKVRPEELETIATAVGGLHERVL